MSDTIALNCERIHETCKSLATSHRQITIMEICGTHTMAIARTGLRSLLPKSLRLISGPGCPVCVTDQSYVDQAVLLAKGVGAAQPPIIATYGDMVRVPGRSGSLAEARSEGAAVKVVYSVDQAVDLAVRTPDRQVVFLAVGFETTAPGTALGVLRARQEGVGNFSVLTAHKLVMPALKALLAMPQINVDGFLCPGHVSVILGYGVYEEIVRDHKRPCVVAGFDPQQIVDAVAEIVRQIRAGSPAASTVYPSVSREGNRTAQKMLADVFRPADAMWRAVGVILGSGLVLRDEFADFDAARRFNLPPAESYEMPGCRCGLVITGQLSPRECPMFGRKCTPRDPLGPCMVSSEGACAAAYKYGA